MKTKLVLSLSIGLLLFTSLNLMAQKDSTKKPDYYKVSKVRIFINDQSDVFELRKQGLGFEHIKLHDNYFDAILDSFQIEKLRKSGYLYEIIIDDVTKDYLERTKDSREKIKLNKPCKGLGFGFGSMGGFYTFNEVVAQLDTMRLLYPNLITVKDSTGSSIEGRTIWAVKISDNPDVNENEPQVFYNALTHAREPGGMMAIMYFMYYLLENYGVLPEVTYLVPVINPDGYIYNETISPNGGGMWYKNRRDNGDGSIGVNLNSNFGYQWGYDDIGSSPVTTSNFYRGTGPFSEPETQVVRDYCINHNFLIGVNYHTTSGMAYWRVVFPPWGYNLEQTSDSTIYNQLIRLVIALNNYSNGAGIGRNNGDVADWMYGETNEKNKIFGIIPEIGEKNGTNWPSLERILLNCEENLYPNLVYAWAPGIIENPPYISNASINPSYCRPLLDTVKIFAIETNPDNHSSYVIAKVLNLNDSLISEFQLNQNDSSFIGSLFLNSANEEFYKILLQQNGIDIPSKLIYNNLKFTTAGPVVLDSISYRKGLLSNHYLRPYVHNWSNVTTITNAKLRFICNDPWIASIGQSDLSLPNISTNSTVGISTWLAVKVIDSLFPGYFNLRAEIKVDGWTYWEDSTQVIVTGVEEALQQPLTFKLEQNYPNPFNPTTKITYNIPSVTLRQAQSDMYVTLKVYGVLGNEIATLVDEEKEAGRYEVEFNAENLTSGVSTRGGYASGIYFYQLKAGEFVSTKKMILLR